MPLYDVRVNNIIWEVRDEDDGDEELVNDPDGVSMIIDLDDGFLPNDITFSYHLRNAIVDKLNQLYDNRYLHDYELTSYERVERRQANEYLTYILNRDGGVRLLDKHGALKAVARGDCAEFLRQAIEASYDAHTVWLGFPSQEAYLDAVIRNTMQAYKGRTQHLEIVQ
jgi:hypothetical protein